MSGLETLTYEVTGRVARITLNRPERGNGITPAMPGELAACVERANLDPAVHAIALAGNGAGFCGGYDLVEFAEGAGRERTGDAPPGSPLDPEVQARNHDPARPRDPVVDYQMMSRNVRGFMSLFHSEKPVVCKVHGFCVAGGTDMALCADLLVIASDARIGYPPARVWGVPTTALWAHRVGPERTKRLLFTGDLISGAEAHEWGLAIDAPAPTELDARFEALLERVALTPVNQLVDDEAAREPGALRPRSPRDPAARHAPRRRGPPHPGGVRVPAPGGPGGLARGGTRARRALRVADAFCAGRPGDGGRAGRHADAVTVAGPIGPRDRREIIPSGWTRVARLARALGAGAAPAGRP